jgi:hypothetical protein
MIAGNHSVANIEKAIVRAGTGLGWVMTKCLGIRLKKVLPNIIHSDQTGFTRGRYIGDNITNILEIIEAGSPSVPGDLPFLNVLIAETHSSFEIIPSQFNISSSLSFGISGSSGKKKLLKETL